MEAPAILKAMQRRYKVEDYHRVIHKVKEIIPDAGIGVDVIVGFPGETEENFLETYNFLRDLTISYLHVFTYSERPDTKAIALPDKVAHSERKRRNSMLRILSEKKRNLFYNEMLGKDLKVLFESENIDGMTKGFSSNYVRVEHPFDPNIVNEFSIVNITKVNEVLCEGTLKEIKNSVASEIVLP